MSSQKCFGIDPASGQPIVVRFDAVITGVDDLIDPYPAPLPYLSAGFIDLQVNGYAGVDYNSPLITHAQIAHSLRVQFACGVTRLLPTVITGGREAMLGSLRNLHEARLAVPEGAAIAGFHVEGPHISAEDGPRGAHPIQHVRPPDVDEYRAWQQVTDRGIK